MFKNKIFWLIVLIVALVLLAWYLASRPWPKPNFIANQTNSIVVQPAENSVIEPQVIIKDKVFKVVVANEPALQREGLSSQADLAEDSGMLFVYAGYQILTFWMKDMKFNVDLLWIKDDSIVAFEKNMPAPAAGISDDQLLRYSSPVAVDKVLEFGSGTIDALGIKAGDKVIFKNI
ncbi:MAG: DUF192 domain-containing protein [Patescibacteria group bacterium]